MLRINSHETVPAVDRQFLTRAELFGAYRPLLKINDSLDSVLAGELIQSLIIFRPKSYLCSTLDY